MGKGVEMKLSPIGLICFAALVALVGCGQGPDAQDTTQTTSALTSIFNAGRHPSQSSADPAAEANLRAALEKARQPIYRVSIASRSYATLMAPYGMNQGVQTWASTSYETISLRDGVLVATRGFGSDLMGAAAPALAQISKPNQQFARIYTFLDGADQTQHFDYTCTTAAGPSETVVILGKSYPARQIVETCDSATGSITNRYWFDAAGNLRQSDQFWAPGQSVMRMQHVLD